jgi:hypothetical protein
MAGEECAARVGRGDWLDGPRGGRDSLSRFAAVLLDRGHQGVNQAGHGGLVVRECHHGDQDVTIGHFQGNASSEQFRFNGVPMRTGAREQHDELGRVDAERPGGVPVRAVGHHGKPWDSGEPVAGAPDQLNEPANQVGAVVL